MSPRNAIPDLPEAVLGLPADVLEELMGVAHVQRRHGKRTCYTAGCRGPLCRRADRLFNRDRYEEARRRDGKPYKPSDLRRDERDDELDAAMAVYDEHQRAIEIVVRLTDLYREMEKTG